MTKEKFRKGPGTKPPSPIAEQTSRQERRRGRAPVGSACGATRFRPRAGSGGGDAGVDPMKRADALLREVTVQEKAMQLSCIAPLALLQ